MKSPAQRLTAALLAFTLAAPLFTLGCQTVREGYYNAWENYGGYAKRERLVDDVKDARNAQEKAKEQFVSALEQFKEVANFDGGNLERVYNKLNKELERSEGRAETVHEQIQQVKNVSKALFEEWKGEIELLKDDPSIQQQSQKLYDQTLASYNELVGKMDAAADKMGPVLTKFRSRVLFLKHNLNAQAIASLKGTEVELSEEIDALITDMEASIAEADAFISEMQG